MLLAERQDPRDPRPAAREVGVHAGQRGPARADRGLPAGAEAPLSPAGGAGARDGAVGRPQSRAPRAVGRAGAYHRGDGRRRTRRCGPPAGHVGRRRAVHGHVPRGRLRRAAAVAAAAALPGVRVRPAGVLAAGARRRDAADADGAVPVRRRRRVRLLLRAAERDQLPAELQRRQLRHPAPGAGLLQVRDHGPDADGGPVPGPGRHPRDHARRASSRRRSCARTAAT